MLTVLDGNLAFLRYPAHNLHHCKTGTTRASLPFASALSTRVSGEDRLDSEGWSQLLDGILQAVSGSASDHEEEDRIHKQVRQQNRYGRISPSQKRLEETTRK